MFTTKIDTIVIILTFNQQERTVCCLKSVLKQDYPSFKVLVWDNGSRDETVEAITKEFPDVSIYSNPKNLGVAEGRNKAAEIVIKTFKPEFLLFLDNDMIIEPGFIKELMEPLKSDPTIGQTQAKLRFMYDKDRLNDGGGCQINFLTGKTMPVGYGEIDHGQHDQNAEHEDQDRAVLSGASQGLPEPPPNGSRRSRFTRKSITACFNLRSLSAEPMHPGCSSQKTAAFCPSSKPGRVAWRSRSGRISQRPCRSARCSRCIWDCQNR